MSSRTGKHHKPRHEVVRRVRSRHRKPSPVASALQQTPVRLTAAGAGLALTVTVAGPATVHWLGSSEHGTGFDQASSVRGATTSAHTTSGQAGSSSISFDVHGRTSRQTAPLATPVVTTRKAKRAAPVVTATARPRGRHHKPAAQTAVYLNPLRDISGLIPERVDQGADFGGSGPIFAIGDAVVTNAQGNNGGWPGGGWITYQLTDGPAAGLVVYVAEDVTPTVSVGEHVTPQTQVATMYNGGSGIETGWAWPNGASAESQLPVAGGINGGGPFPTDVGLNYDSLLQALGVPAAPNWSTSGYGILPSNYPSDWSALLKG